LSVRQDVDGAQHLTLLLVQPDAPPVPVPQIERHREHDIFTVEATLPLLDPAHHFVQIGVSMCLVHRLQDLRRVLYQIRHAHSSYLRNRSHVTLSLEHQRGSHRQLLQFPT
jgi:hypothetical protein